MVQDYSRKPASPAGSNTATASPLQDIHIRLKKRAFWETGLPQGKTVSPFLKGRFKERLSRRESTFFERKKMKIVSSLIVLVIMLIGLGTIINGPAGSNWAFRTLVRNPSQAGLQAIGRGLRRIRRWTLSQLWMLARRYPQMAIIIILFIIVLEIYLYRN